MEKYLAEEVSCQYFYIGRIYFYTILAQIAKFSMRFSGIAGNSPYFSVEIFFLQEQNPTHFSPARFGRQMYSSPIFVHFCPFFSSLYPPVQVSAAKNRSASLLPGEAPPALRATVRLAVHKPTAEFYAVKCLRKCDNLRPARVCNRP